MAHWISELEQSRGKVPPNLDWIDGQNFFFRVRDLLGQNPAAARNLASHWPKLSRHDLTKPWALRTKAVLQRLDGRWAASARSFLAAAEGVANPLDRLEFQLGAVDSLGRCGRVRDAVALGSRLAEGLRKGERFTDAGRAWLNVANALLWHDQYSEAAKGYRIALTLLDPDDPMTGSALLGVSTGELFGGKPHDAIEAAERAAAHFQALAVPHFESLARVNLGHAALLLGRLDEALDALLDARSTVEPGSPEASRLEEFLGDCYLRLNLFDEAQLAYQVALTGRSTGLNKGNAQYGLGLVAEAQDRLTEADNWFRTARASYLRFGNQTWASVCLSSRSRIARKRQDPARAVRLAQTSVECLRSQRSRYHLCEALLNLAEAQVDLSRDASEPLREASGLVRRSQYLALQWQVSHIRARMSSRAQSLKHYRRMVNEILAVRALTTSILSRTAFYRDKSDALGTYIGFLLNRPNRSRVNEALQVIRRIRSVTLLEEIFSQQGHKVPDFVAGLSELREEINVALSSESSVDGSRRLTTTRAELSRLQRRWFELTRTVSMSGSVDSLRGAADGVILAHTPVGLFIVSDHGSKKLADDRNELEPMLRRLKFELFAPMVDKNADVGCVQHAVQALQHSLEMPQKLPIGFAICPDGPFWQVPWSLLDLEPVLTIGPWKTQKEVSLPRSPRVALWYQEHTDLPHILREIDVLRARFPKARVCTTTDEVRDCLANDSVDVLHVATHARFHPSNPMFSHLEFKDGVVTAAEVARSAFSCNIVCLSACETGMVSQRNKSEPEGLVRSFLARGAARVIASSWPLDDQAAELFAYHFYEALAEGGDVSQSVASSRAFVRAKFEHPYYWGPFTVFGGFCRDS